MSGQAKTQAQSECVRNANLHIGTEKEKFIVYKITNTKNEKIYIGQTFRTLKVRKGYHISAARRGCQSILYKAIRKYGVENFTFETLFYCISEKQMNQKEIDTIREMKTKIPLGYNMTDGGEGKLGHIISKEVRTKISAFQKGRKTSNKTKAKMRVAAIGRRLTNETKEKLRILNIGRKVSNETRAKISKVHLGNKYTLGHKHSIETKMKMSIAKKGRKVTEEMKINMSIAQKGRKATEETKTKMRKSQTKRWLRGDNPARGVDGKFYAI